MNERSTGIVSRSMPVQALLGDVNELFDLARDKQSSSRAKLADEISKLLAAGVSTRESELVADVLIELIDQAKKDLRLVLAQKLSTFNNVPLRLVLQLANDELDVAEPILRYSPDLGELDLMYIIKSKTAEYWEVIAQRKNLTGQVVDLLAETEDFNTAIALVQNQDITLTDNALTILSDIAQGSDELALPLIRRDEVDHELAQALYRFVGEEIKVFIDENFALNDAAAQDAKLHVESAVQELSDDASDCADDRSSLPLFGEFIPESHMIDAAHAYRGKGVLNVPMMMETLRQNRIRSFVAMFSVYADLSLEMVGQILSQTDGKSLAIVARSCGIEKQDFISIFMMTGKVWNNGQLVAMDQIKGALDYYNNMTRDMADRIVREKMRL